MTIERSTGIPAEANGVLYGFAGAGYQGCTQELDGTVAEAARLLADAYGMDVTIRFNSDRESGGAYLRTHAVDSIDANAEVGIGARIVTASARARWERSASRYEREAETGIASWQAGPLTSDQREGARELAALWRRTLAENPAGQLTVDAHIRATSADPAHLAELRDLPGWNPYGSGYHHGDAGSVQEALARCLRFAPKATIRTA
jgi:hypothetical protein